MDGFIERDEAEAGAYLAEEIGGGVTREQLLESMEELLVFTKKAVDTWEDEFGALVFATVARSGRTFDGICKLLRAGLAVQAAMLCRTLFEDMIVGHWLLYNQGDHEWLVERFLRHREAIALHKERIRDATGSAAMGPPLRVADDVKRRLASDRRGCEPEGDSGVHGPRHHRGDLLPLRPPDARHPRPGAQSGRRLHESLGCLSPLTAPALTFRSRKSRETEVHVNGVG